jgi:hypothetical protein
MRNLSEKKVFRRLAKLGVSNFETIDETRQRQAIMLRRLKNSNIDWGYYAGLADCSPEHCGRVKCAEGCYFGTHHRRISEIAAVHRLFALTDGPLCEVRIIREVWARPFGQLGAVSIKAAKQLNRRALDNLHKPGIVAAGTFKVAPEYMGRLWKCEMGIPVMADRHST